MIIVLVVVLVMSHQLPFFSGWHVDCDIRLSSMLSFTLVMNTIVLVYPLPQLTRSVWLVSLFVCVCVGGCACVGVLSDY